jgi:hypothetical protein
MSVTTPSDSPSGSGIWSASATRDTCSRNSATPPSGIRSLNSRATPTSSDRFSTRLSSCGSTLGGQLGEVAGAVEHRLEHLAGGMPAVDERAHLVHQRGELGDGLGAARRHAAHLVAAAQRLGEGHALAGGEGLEAGLGAVADAPARGVEDAAQAHRVGRVGEHPQVGQRVAHLLRS